MAKEQTSSKKENERTANTTNTTNLLKIIKEHGILENKEARAVKRAQESQSGNWQFAIKERRKIIG